MILSDVLILMIKSVHTIGPNGLYLRIKRDILYPCNKSSKLVTITSNPLKIIWKQYFVLFNYSRFCSWCDEHFHIKSQSQILTLVAVKSWFFASPFKIREKRFIFLHVFWNHLNSTNAFPLFSNHTNTNKIKFFLKFDRWDRFCTQPSMRKSVKIVFSDRWNETQRLRSPRIEIINSRYKNFIFVSGPPNKKFAFFRPQIFFSQIKSLITLVSKN